MSELPNNDKASSSRSSDGNSYERRRSQFLDDSPEFGSDYGSGKLHPVHFGDLFARYRYKILRKIGCGSFSTAWLVKDKWAKKYVVLKIPTAENRVSENEIKVHDHLSRQNLQHPGQKHVTGLLDSFEHHGPNGTHRCLVLDVMGPNANNMMVKIPRPLRPAHPPVRDPYGKRYRYPLWMAKTMLRQILLGIDYLHKNDVVHGDLQPGNILFSVQDLSSLPEKALAHSEVSPKIYEKTVNRRGEVKFQDLELDNPNARKGYYTQRQIDGKPDPTVPRYLVAKEPMFDFVDFDAPLHVKICDLGGAVLRSQGKPSTPLGLRSPEMILGEAIGPAQDIWNFGCLIFEFLTSTMLFAVSPPHLFNWNPQQAPSDYQSSQDVDESPEKRHARRTEEKWANTNDDHILEIARLFGPVSKSFMARFVRSSTYFNAKGQTIKYYVGEPLLSEDESDEYYQEPYDTPYSIEEYLDQEKGTDLSRKDWKIVSRLLRSILKFDPADRPTAETLLAHPWFNSVTKPNK